MKLFVYSLIACLVASLASAEDIPAPSTQVFGKGMVCKQATGIEETITRIALGETVQQPPEGCFMLKKRVTVLVEPEYWYESPDAFNLIARVTPSQGDTRYMMIAFKPKVISPEPAALGQDT